MWTDRNFSWILINGHHMSHYSYDNCLSHLYLLQKSTLSRDNSSPITLQAVGSYVSSSPYLFIDVFILIWNLNCVRLKRVAKFAMFCDGYFE